MRWSVLFVLLVGMAPVSCECRCGAASHQTEGSVTLGDLHITPRKDAFALAPLPREPGPAHPETAAEIAAARRRARAFVATLKGSLNPREITALADIRGYGFYRRRFFGRAHEWFLAAVATDPRFELSLYNAARTAALLGRRSEARRLLERLRVLDTPLARMRLKLATRDPDLSRLRGEKPSFLE
jgi:hypothetical protein